MKPMQLFLTFALRSFLWTAGVLLLGKLLKKREALSAVTAQRLLEGLSLGLLFPYELFWVLAVKLCFRNGQRGVSAAAMELSAVTEQMRTASALSAGITASKQAVVPPWKAFLQSNWTGITAAVFFIWLAGAGLFWTWAFSGRRRLNGAVKELGEPCGIPSFCEAFTKAARELAIAHPPKMMVLPLKISPFLSEVGRGTIVLPQRTYGPGELEAVLRHELTHWKRGDLQKERLWEALQAIYWFNPLVRSARKLCHEFSESACDEVVLKNRNSEEIKTYCKTILTILLEQTEERDIRPAISFAGSPVERRIQHMLKLGKLKTAHSARLLALLLGVTLALASVGVCYAAEQINVFDTGEALPAIELSEEVGGEDENGSYQMCYHIDYANPTCDDLSQPATLVSETLCDEDGLELLGLTEYSLALENSEAYFDGLLWKLSFTALEQKDGSGSMTFEVAEEQPWFRVYLRNAGNCPLYYTIRYGSPDAEPFAEGQIPAEGEDTDQYLGVWHSTSFGTFYITVSSQDGTPVKGSAAVRCAASEAELDT